MELMAPGRVDGMLKVTGQATYTADLHPPGLLYAAVVRSPYAHARIVTIDTVEAAALPGVHAVITGKDIPYGTFGRSCRDHPALARDVVRFIGEGVAAVAAETQDLAEAAAALVAVEYEPLPAVLDAAAALAPDAPKVHAAAWQYPGAVVTPDHPPNLQAQNEWAHGDEIEAALARSHRVFEHTFRTPARHQGYLETHVCMASVTDDGIDVWAANKGPYRLQEQLAAGMGIDPARIRVHPVAIGGDFGGKGAPMAIPLCVALSTVAGRPVRLRLRYAEDLTAGNPRHPCVIRARLGVDAEHRFTAFAMDALVDGGAYAAFKPSKLVQLMGIAAAGNCYRIPSIHIRSRIAYTHTVPKGHMRAPGAPQAVFATEALVDMAARELGVDPVALRRQNMLRTGEPDPMGEEWLEIRSDDTLNAALAKLAALPPQPQPADGDWAPGTGLTFYLRSTHGGITEVALAPEPDGTLTVWVPFPDQGGGQFTMARNVVLAELGLPPALLRVRQAELADLSYDNGVGGSRTTVDAAEALTLACRDLRRALSAGGLPANPTPEQVTAALSRLASTTDGQRITGRMDNTHMPHVTSFCVQLARVRVDRATGQVVVDDIVTALDVANVLNPLSHQVQVEGGVVMGFGGAVMEDLLVEDGKVTAANLGDYKLPSVQDVPALHTVLVEGSRGVGAQNIKAIGELTNPALPAVVANAVAAAVGVHIDSMPITAEKVFFALHPEEAVQ